MRMELGPIPANRLFAQAGVCQGQRYRFAKWLVVFAPACFAPQSPLTDRLTMACEASDEALHLLDRERIASSRDGLRRCDRERDT